MAAMNAAAPQGRFNGLGTYFDAAHLASAELSAIWSGAPDVGTAVAQTLNLPFHPALLFTLAYTTAAVAGPWPVACAVGHHLAPQGAQRGHTCHAITGDRTVADRRVVTRKGGLVMRVEQSKV